jgi:hypothetical protein
MSSSMHLDRIGRRLIENGNTSLKNIEMDFTEIEELVETQTDEYDDILLTSSSVQGLATSTSDVDIICVTRDDMQGQRASAQIFHRDRRVEIMLYTPEEIALALQLLHQIDASNLPATLAAVQGWDRKSVIRFKYFERLINGVSVSNSAPYIQNLPKLAEAWRVVSYNQARQFVAFALLAERAGERSSPAVYAMKAIAQLMDLTLSRYGLVYTNPKWYALRWTRFAGDADNQAGDDAIAAEITACWPRALQSFEAGAATAGLGDELLRILLMVEELEGYGRFWANVPTIYSHKGAVEHFSGDGGIWFDPASTMIMATRFQDLVAPIPTLSALSDLEPDIAVTLLRAARAKLIDFSLAAWVG